MPYHYHSQEQQKRSKSPSTDENNVLQLASPMGNYDRCSLEMPLRHHTVTLVFLSR